MRTISLAMTLFPQRETSDNDYLTGAPPPSTQTFTLKILDSLCAFWYLAHRILFFGHHAATNDDIITMHSSTWAQCLRVCWCSSTPCGLIAASTYLEEGPKPEPGHWFWLFLNRLAAPTATSQQALESPLWTLLLLYSFPCAMVLWQFQYLPIDLVWWLLSWWGFFRLLRRAKHRLGILRSLLCNRVEATCHK